MRRLIALASRYFVPLSVAALGSGYALYLYVYATKSTFHALDWKLTQYHVSYQDFGFVRRGFVGSVLYPIFGLFQDGGMGERLVIVGFDLIVFAVLLGLLVRSLQTVFPGASPIADAIRAILVLSPVGFMQYGYDAGRYDHVNFVILILALKAVRNRRMLVCGLWLALAVLVHEAVLFYGVPVFVAYTAMHSRRAGPVAAVAVPVGIAAMAVALFGAPGLDLVATLGPELADGANAWNRGLFEVQLWLGWPHYAVAVFFGSVPLLLLAMLYRRNGYRPDLIFVAVFAALVLYLLGIDYFRWAQLVFVATALGLALRHSLSPIPARDGIGKAGAVLLSVYVIPLGPVGIDAGLPYVAKILEMAGLPWLS